MHGVGIFPFSISAGNETKIALGCALIGLYLTSLLSVGSLGVVSTSWWMQSESARSESKTEGIFLKDEYALTVSCTSYQECSCHLKF